MNACLAPHILFFFTPTLLLTSTPFRLCTCHCYSGNFWVLLKFSGIPGSIQGNFTSLDSVRQANGHSLSSASKFRAGQIENWPGRVEFSIEHIKVINFWGECSRNLHWNWYSLGHKMSQFRLNYCDQSCIWNESFHVSNFEMTDIFSGVEVHAFGSSANGFGFRGSDIDIFADLCLDKIPNANQNKVRW